MFLLGVALAPVSPWAHQALAGLAGGFSFPVALTLSVVTSLAGGYPRRGFEAAAAALTLYLAPLAPLAALVSPRLAASAAAAALASYAAYSVVQAREAARRGRADRALTPLAPIPPASGALAAAWAAAGGWGVVELAAALGALYTLPQVVLLSPLTAGQGIYGRRVRVAAAAVAATPATWAAMAAGGAGAALAAAGVQASIYAAALLASGLPRAFAEGGFRGYAAALHLSVPPSAALLALHGELGLGVVEALHLLYMGILMPHPLIHATVRGGVLPFTVKPRRWTRAVGLALAASALTRPWAPTASWLLLAAALLAAAALVASPRPKPPAFEALKGGHSH
jgi:hypothetical protein